MLQQPSSAPGGSGRLKYADPRDLPSYPSTGLRPDGAAASAAASLGWANQKPVECWKPEKTSSASAAAALAKDYKAAPVWQPDNSSSDGARAALLAHSSARSAAATEQPSKNPHHGWGNSAATQAFSASQPGSTAVPQHSTSSGSLEGRKSLAAAKGAMAVKRRRAASTPVSAATTEAKSPEDLAASNALSGATLAHQASMKSKSTEHPVGGASSVTNMTRQMFTSHPPVKLEVDEKQNQDKLHASAVAMARKLYEQHQQRAATQNQESQNEDGSVAQPKPYINLQDAAFKQAQERLAKLQDEHQKQRELNDYYGSTTSTKHRFSITNKLRRRSSSDGNVNVDQQQSEKIRQQMSMFSNKLSEIDEQKRKEDRDALLAAAQRNVKARLHDMDEKVLQETGQVNPTLSSEWEVKAQQLAFASHESRNENKGKVDIGGGKFMDPTEVNAIALKRVQPVLDDIHEKAEAEKARVLEAKMEEEARKADLEKQKVREREVKEIQKKIKEEERQDDKAKRAEEKAARAEKKRLEKEKRKSKTDGTGTVENEAGGEDKPKAEESGQRTEPAEQKPEPALDTDAGHATSEDQTTPSSSTSPTSKVKGWIKNRFSRGKSVSEGDKKRGFSGGAAIRDPGLNHSSTSLDHRSSSMRDVALAGRQSERAPKDETAGRDSRGVSPMSSRDGDEQDPGIVPPKPIKDSGARSSSSPSRDSRFREMMDR